MNLIRYVFGCLLVFILAGCGGESSGGPSQPDGGDGDAVHIVSLQVTPSTAAIPVGFEQQYMAQATMSDGSVLDVTKDSRLSWKSSENSTATIDATGLAKGVALGVVTITATGTSIDGTVISAATQLEVTDAQVTNLQVTPAQGRIPVGLAQPYTATAFFSDGSALDVTSFTGMTWSVNDAAIATIDSTEHKGLATGVSPGIVTITASGIANDKSFSATAELTVTSATVAELQVTPVTTTVALGLEQQFTATAVLSDGGILDVTDNAALSWHSSDLAIASISSKGVATGVSPGVVTITASGNTNGKPFSATAELKVTNATVTKLRVTPATATVASGLEQRFIATAVLSDGSILNVTNYAALSWRSSEPAIATIGSVDGSKGLATGVSPGVVTITASGSASGTSFSATAELTVTSATVTELQVTPATATVASGLEQQFTAMAVLSDGGTLDVTDNAALSWRSSDLAIATVGRIGGNKGLATGVSPGVVTITASGSANGTPFSAQAELAVTNATVTELQITPATATVESGLEQQFTATAVLSDGGTLDVTDNAALGWRSSEPAIATISSVDGSKGLAIGVSPGGVTITASADVNGTSFSATAELAVEEPLVFSMPDTTVRRWSEADAFCKGFVPTARLPSVKELQNLYLKNTSATEIGSAQKNSEMCTIYGWPLSDGLCGGTFPGAYWTSEVTLFEIGYHNAVDMMTGGRGKGQDSSASLHVTCVLP